MLMLLNTYSEIDGREAGEDGRCDSGRERWGREGDSCALHGGTRGHIPSLDERPFSSPSHRLRTPLSPPWISHANLLDPRPSQYSLSLTLSLLRFELCCVCFGDWFLFFYFIYNFVERTFIVLDKDLVVGEFVHGDPHVEGKQISNAFFLFSHYYKKSKKFFFFQYMDVPILADDKQTSPLWSLWSALVLFKPRDCNESDNIFKEIYRSLMPSLKILFLFNIFCFVYGIWVSNCIRFCFFQPW